MAATRRQPGEGSVYRRARDGQWVAVADLGYRNGKRDRREFTGPASKIALARRKAFLDRQRDGFTMPKGREPYVSEWVTYWLHHIVKRRVAVTTWEKSYRQKATDLVCPYFESVPLSELSEEHVEQWHARLEARISDRTGRPLSPQTVKHAHRIMSSAIKAAVVRGKLPRNPLSNVPPPQVAEAETELPTAAEVDRILERCRTRPNGARWIVAVTTGLRQGEALGLEWPQVTLDAPASVQVEWSAAWVKGERIRKRPKSRTSRRSVPLPQRAVRALRELRDEGGVRRISGPVFLNGRGEPERPRPDWQDWKDLLAELGMPGYRVHDIRHGYATMLLERGTDPRVVAALLGHSTTALLGRYEHVREVMHLRVADAIDDALGS